jgi:hypothetical protein
VGDVMKSEYKAQAAHNRISKYLKFYRFLTEYQAQRITDNICKKFELKDVKIKFVYSFYKIKPGWFARQVLRIQGYRLGRNDSQEVRGQANYNKGIITLYYGGHDTECLLHEIAHMFNDDFNFGHNRTWERDFLKVIKYFNWNYKKLL